MTGRILPVGGVKEKLLADHRAGIQTVILPAKNLVDRVEIPDDIQQGLNIVPIEEISQAVELVLKNNLSMAC